MASEGAKGEQPPPLQTLLTAGHGSVETVREHTVFSLTFSTIRMQLQKNGAETRYIGLFCMFIAAPLLNSYRIPVSLCVDW